jgi:predicted GNAT family acetyltransferase
LAADVPKAQPFMALIEGGRAVSICASVRISGAVHCAGVETHPDHRQRGYASEVVAAWAQAAGVDFSVT